MPLLLPLPRIGISYLHYAEIGYIKIDLLSFQILYEFSNKFEKFNDFIAAWPSYSVKLDHILALKQVRDFATMWTGDINDLLKLVRLLPARQRGRNTVTQGLSFQKVIDKLIVFSRVGF